MTQYQTLNRAILKITGDDAAKFLQALITNDIHSAKTIYAMMLSSGGRFVYDFFITHLEDGYLIDTDIINLKSLIEKLKIYIMRSKVVIEDMTQEHQVIYTKQDFFHTKLLCIYKDPRFSKMGFRSVISKTDSLKTTTCIYQTDKYLYAIPDGNVDLIPDKSMPQEYGMDHLNAISYTKGCYLGQEMICRTNTQGTIRKQIFKIKADVSLNHIPQGTAILGNADKIGVLCSAYNNYAISLIRTENYTPRKQMHLTLLSIPITLDIPEWMKSV